MTAVILLHALGMMICLGCKSLAIIQPISKKDKKNQKLKFIGFAANIVIIMISSYTASTSNLYASVSYYSQTTTQSPAPVTFNKYIYANIIIAVFGILCLPLTISFMIAIQCLLGGCSGNNQRRTVGQTPYGNSMGYGNTMPMSQPYMSSTTVGI